MMNDLARAMRRWTEKKIKGNLISEHGSEHGLEHGSEHGTYVRLYVRTYVRTSVRTYVRTCVHVCVDHLHRCKTSLCLLCAFVVVPT